MQEEVAQLEGNITIVGRNAASATNDLDDLEKSVDEKFSEVSSELGSLKSNTSENGRKLSDISVTIGSIETDLDSVEGKVVQLERADFRTQIQNVTDVQTAQENELKDLDERLDQIEVSSWQILLVNFETFLYLENHYKK